MGAIRGRKGDFTIGNDHGHQRGRMPDLPITSEAPFRRGAIHTLLAGLYEGLEMAIEENSLALVTKCRPIQPRTTLGRITRHPRICFRSELIRGNDYRYCSIALRNSAVGCPCGSSVKWEFFDVDRIGARPEKPPRHAGPVWPPGFSFLVPRGPLHPANSWRAGAGIPVSIGCGLPEGVALVSPFASTNAHASGFWTRRLGRYRVMFHRIPAICGLPTV
jgi:hypothetical protein